MSFDGRRKGDDDGVGVVNDVDVFDGAVGDVKSHAILSLM